MPLQPNKPFLFAVPHFPKEVDKAIDLFKQSLVGKTTLFVELTKEELAEETSAYDGVQSYLRLVNEAKKVGLKIVPLDRNDWNEKYLDDYHFKRVRNVSEDELNYQNLVKREKLWVEKLRNATSKDIVVMSPGHAEQFQLEFKIPAQNCIFTRRFQGDFANDRRVSAMIGARKIKEIRTQRALNRARSRAGKLRAVRK
ncbi:MAG: hypothetical protein AABW59_04245 [archaeon]